MEGGGGGGGEGVVQKPKVPFKGRFVWKPPESLSFQGEPQNHAQRLEITRAQLQQMWPKLKGLPILQEHTGVDLGRVEEPFWDEDGSAMISFTFNDSPEASFTQMLVEKGGLKGLSLKHDPNNLEPLEISVVIEGARPNTTITHIPSPPQALQQSPSAPSHAQSVPVAASSSASSSASPSDATDMNTAKEMKGDSYKQTLANPMVIYIDGASLRLDTSFSPCIAKQPVAASSATPTETVTTTTCPASALQQQPQQQQLQPAIVPVILMQQPQPPQQQQQLQAPVAAAMAHIPTQVAMQHALTGNPPLLTYGALPAPLQPPIFAYQQVIPPLQQQQQQMPLAITTNEQQQLPPASAATANTGNNTNNNKRKEPESSPTAPASGKEEAKENQGEKEKEEKEKEDEKELDLQALINEVVTHQGPLSNKTRAFLLEAAEQVKKKQKMMETKLQNSEKSQTNLQAHMSDVFLKLMARLGGNVNAEDKQVINGMLSSPDAQPFLHSATAHRLSVAASSFFNSPPVALSAAEQEELALQQKINRLLAQRGATGVSMGYQYTPNNNWNTNPAFNQFVQQQQQQQQQPQIQQPLVAASATTAANNADDVDAAFMQKYTSSGIRLNLPDTTHKEHIGLSLSDLGLASSSSSSSSSFSPPSSASVASAPGYVYGRPAAAPPVAASSVLASAATAAAAPTPQPSFIDSVMKACSGNALDYKGSKHFTVPRFPKVLDK